ncbi:MAG: hypothetical protein ACMG6E_04585, partial [Candidatus Roizmanbacteria bacterium]
MAADQMLVVLKRGHPLHDIYPYAYELWQRGEDTQLSNLANKTFKRYEILVAENERLLQLERAKKSLHAFCFSLIPSSGLSEIDIQLLKLFHKDCSSAIYHALLISNNFSSDSFPYM